MPRALVALIATLALVAAAPAASADETTPTPTGGITQVCEGVQGGFVAQWQGFGIFYPPHVSGTVTIRPANGEVYTLTATTDDTGRFETEILTFDMRDPEIAALANTYVFGSIDFGSLHYDMVFPFVGCPTAPDGRLACLDGGFERYPQLGFLNQGDCIAWLATSGKNEPGKNSR